MAKKTVFVDGQEGTTGLQIREVLAGRSDIEVLTIDADRRKDSAERARLLNAADVAFLCLPDAASREAAAMVSNPRTCVIDASTAHRTSPDWVFGLPELASDQRARIRASKRISNPGCHSTSFLLLARPLIDAGLLAPTQPITATSLTGYSGGGKKMIEDYEQSGNPVLRAPRPYALTLAHKHLPEMIAHSGLQVAPVFLPIVSNYYKGLAVTIPLHLSAFAAGTTPETIHACYTRAYATERFIRVTPIADPETLAHGFDVQASNDTNRVDIFVFANATQVLLVGRLDNLGKGASGAAVQSMNLHLGMDEGLGLRA